VRVDDAFVIRERDQGEEMEKSFLSYTHRHTDTHTHTHTHTDTQHTHTTQTNKQKQQQQNKKLDRTLRNCAAIEMVVPRYCCSCEEVRILPFLGG